MRFARNDRSGDLDFDQWNVTLPFLASVDRTEYAVTRNQVSLARLESNRGAPVGGWAGAVII